jgi:hypothetical protein
MSYASSAAAAEGASPVWLLKKRLKQVFGFYALGRK